MNLRKKMTILLLVSAVVPLLMLSGLVVVLVRQQIEKQTTERLALVADRVVNRAGAVVLRGRETANSLASLTVVQRYVVDYKQISQPTFNEPLLKQLVEESNGSVLHVWIADAQGKVIASDTNYLVETAVVTQLLEANRELEVIGTTETGLNLLIPGRVLTVDGVAGYLLAEMPIGDQLAVLMKTDELGMTGEALLFNRERSDNESIQVISPFRFPEDEVVKTPELRKAVFSGVNTIQRNMTDYRNKRVVAVGRYMPAFDWAVVAKMDESEMLIPLNLMTLSISGVTLLSTVLILVISFIVSGYLVRPLTQLTLATKELLIKRDWKPVLVNSKDELGILATALNQLMGEIRNSQTLLEDRVNQRTTELAQKAAELEKLNQFMVGREIKMVELKKQLAEKQGGTQ